MLKIDTLRKDYKDFKLDISLDIKEGSVVGLIGQNGAGKTTTFKAILDLIDIDGGTIELFGKQYKQLRNEDKTQFGVVLNDAGFSEYLSIQSIANIMAQMYTAFDKKSFIVKCEQFNLPMKKKIKSFSTGMKAKLKLLLALSHDAKLLILDEPTAGLDVIAREELLDMLRSYMEEEHHSILISSHISSDIESLCDEVYMIHNGAIILHEDTDTLLDCYGIIKVEENIFHTLDKQAIVRVKKEPFGYKCLCNDKQYYLDNYPSIVIEKGSMDEVITMMVKGDTI